MSAEFNFENVMYILSIDDCGEERNFLATSVAFMDDRLRVTIDGCGRAFDLIHLIDLLIIDQAVTMPSYPTVRNTQTRLS